MSDLKKPPVPVSVPKPKSKSDKESKASKADDSDSDDDSSSLDAAATPGSNSQDSLVVTEPKGRVLLEPDSDSDEESEDLQEGYNSVTVIGILLRLLTAGDHDAMQQLRIMVQDEATGGNKLALPVSARLRRYYQQHKAWPTQINRNVLHFCLALIAQKVGAGVEQPNNDGIYAIDRKQELGVDDLQTIVKTLNVSQIIYWLVKKALMAIETYLANEHDLAVIKSDVNVKALLHFVIGLVSLNVNTTEKKEVMHLLMQYCSRNAAVKENVVGAIFNRSVGYASVSNTAKTAVETKGAAPKSQESSADGRKLHHQ